MNKRILAVLLSCSLVFTGACGNTDLDVQQVTDMTEVISEIENYPVNNNDKLFFIDVYSRTLPFENKTSYLIDYYDDSKGEFNWVMLRTLIKHNSSNLYEDCPSYVNCSDEELDNYLDITETYINDICLKYPDIDKNELSFMLSKISFYNDYSDFKSTGRAGVYYLSSNAIIVDPTSNILTVTDIINHELTHVVQDTNYNTLNETYTFGAVSYETGNENQLSALAFNVFNEWIAEYARTDVYDKDMIAYTYYTKYINLLDTIIRPRSDYVKYDTLVNTNLSNDSKKFLDLYQVDSTEDLKKLYKLLYMIDVLNKEIDEDLTNEELSSLLVETLTYGAEMLSKNIAVYTDYDEDVYASYYNDYYFSSSLIIANSDLNQEERNIVIDTIRTNIYDLFNIVVEKKSCKNSF